MLQQNDIKAMNIITGKIEPPRKLQALEELCTILDEHRNNGKRIVLCHGVFDLLHVGHIRHLDEAKSLGDILVVSITEDQNVNKGPHRPAFSENFRAEALAALGCVNFVIISRDPTATEIIAHVQPSFYVKGRDYKDNSSDASGGISLEEQAVLRVGGKMHYTDQITFSSSNLINRHFSPFSLDVENYLQNFRNNYNFKDVISCLDRLRTMKVAVVGEAILDEYIYCDQMGKSAKDPVLAMRYDSKELFAGGSLAIANHLSSFVESVELITYLGTEDTQESFVRANLRENVRTNFIYKSQSPTITKRRYVEKNLRSKHFETYFINDEPINQVEEEELCSLLDARLTHIDTVIAADFGHGLLTPRAINHLSSSQHFLAVNTQINAANIRFHTISAYDRADYICINEQEIRLDARNRLGKLEGLVKSLSHRLACERILVTRGSSGVSYFADGAAYVSPALASSVTDRIGSGDAVLAITAVAVASGAPPPIVALLANVIGAQKVQITGNRHSVERVPTIKFLESLLK